MSPAAKFSPTRLTPASSIALLKASTSAGAGTDSAKGHQNSTAPKPAAFAAAGRCNSGCSVRMEQFTTIGSASNIGVPQDWKSFSVWWKVASLWMVVKFSAADRTAVGSAPARRGGGKGYWPQIRDR